MSANPFDYTNSNENKSKGDTFSSILDFLQYAVLIVSVFVVLYLFFIIPTQVDGVSMSPNFKNDEILLTNRLIAIAGGSNLIQSYNYQRGDIIVYTRTDKPDLIKRVIGLPGESVMIKDNSVFVNGQKLTESYINPQEKPTEPGTFIAEGEEKIVPPNSYFTLGDNRTNSIDSRDARVGWVERDQIKGSPFVRLIPPKIISRPDYPLLSQ
jgi:signal peptidase I